MSKIFRTISFVTVLFAFTSVFSFGAVNFSHNSVTATVAPVSTPALPSLNGYPAPTLPPPSVA